MKKLVRLLLAVAVILCMVGCNGNAVQVKYPSVQEYVAGQGNCKGDVDVASYTALGEAYAIGANANGYAVFQMPEQAFEDFAERFSDGLKLIQKEFRLPDISPGNFAGYQTYGWQVTSGTAEEKKQALFVGQFLDIYENSFVSNESD